MAITRLRTRARPLAAASTALLALVVAGPTATDDRGAGAPRDDSALDVPGALTTDAASARDRVLTPTEIAIAHLQGTVGVPGAARGFTGSDTGSDLELRVDSTARSADVTHVYIQQQLDGIDIVGANANVAVGDMGFVEHAPQRLVPAVELSALDASEAGDANASVSAPRRLGATEAVTTALAHLGVSPTEPLVELGNALGGEELQYVSDGGVGVGPFTTRLVHVPSGKDLTLGWEVEIELRRGDHLRLIVAVDDGRELRRDSYTISHSYVHVHDHDDHDHHLGIDGGPDDDAPSAFSESVAPLVADGSSYLVFGLPVESPLHGSATLVDQPADSIGSPFGWHDTDGIAGAESTLTIGNNVDAYRDMNADNVPDPGSRPDGGPGLDFTTPFNPSAGPHQSTNPDADVIQLFYSNNWAHDFFYAYGFDEAAGNFQVNNYGRGGSGGDPVHAEALDGYGDPADLTPPGVNRNNANFTTPPDGSPARMQMYGFTLTSPERSSALDAGVVIHEYAHGWSTRLTGGRYAVTCLNNGEQMGEGWSDFAALMATTTPGDRGSDPNGIGNWVVGHTLDGRGIRQYPYSTDLTVDPRTYAWVPSASVPHGVGSIWAAMLWELNWAMIDRYGFDPDLLHGDGGNNRTMQLVTDGLKLQPCSPGFTDGRDAILAADRISNDGADQCLIWEAFAKRGLGWSAEQGSPHDPTDGTPAFDLPPGCPLAIEVAEPAPADVGDVIDLDVVVANRGTTDRSGVDAVLDMDAGLAPLTGSVSCDRTATAAVTSGQVTIDLGTVAAGTTVNCSFQARVVDATTAVPAVLAEYFEDGLGVFTSSSTASRSWVHTTSFPRTGASSAFATNPTSTDQTSDQYLTSPPLSIPRCATLEFWHRYHTESSYDGGVVEVRHGDGPWIDLGASMTDGSYTSRIATEYTNSTISGRDAYSGLAWVYGRTSIDLDAHAGNDVRLRFHYASDASVSSAGWWIDDVLVGRADGVVVEATVSSDSAAAGTDCTVFVVNDASPPATSAPPMSTTTTTTTTTTPSSTVPSTTAPDDRPVLDGGHMGGADQLAPASRLGAQG